MDDEVHVLSFGQDRPDEISDSPKDTGLVVVDLAAAAEILNITEDGVRKRIARGKLDATKVDGRWQIVLRLPLSGGQDSPSSGGQTRQQHERTRQTDNRTDVSVRSPNDQLALFRDTFVMPLVAQLRELEHQLADVENARDQAAARAEQAERERDELAAALDRMQAKQDAPVAAPAQPPPEPEESTPPTAVTLGVAWRRWFRRIMGQP